MSAPPLVIYGASGYAVASADVFESWVPKPLATVVAYIDDVRGDNGEAIGAAPVISFETWAREYADTPIFVTIGNPADRRRLVERISAAGGRFSSFYRFNNGPVAHDVVVGTDSMILAYSSVGAGTVIGNHVHVMPLCSIDAGCTIGDFTTLCPMAAVSGPVAIGEGVFIGVGARIANESGELLTIGAGATIAGGAVVTRSVQPGETLAGNPATDYRSLAKGRSA
jgi:sugar O-acyltransferase (sialic acid O-acetyltransferase NeuD family)